MTHFRVALFDVDGVLLDSLGPHLKICEDKNEEYGLGLSIPGPDEFRKMVRGGVRISPMKYFFLAVGFPELYAEMADRQYEAIFTRDYKPAPFAGVPEMLRALHDAGMKMGTVTSNVRANVVDALGESVQFLDSKCIFCKDDSAQLSKSESIITAMAELQAQPAETVYVGDQPADRVAAESAGVQFLGVSYGWGISQDDNGFPIVSTVDAIRRYILSNGTAQTGGVAGL